MVFTSHSAVPVPGNESHDHADNSAPGPETVVLHWIVPPSPDMAPYLSTHNNIRILDFSIRFGRKPLQMDFYLHSVEIGREAYGSAA